MCWGHPDGPTSQSQGAGPSTCVPRSGHWRGQAQGPRPCCGGREWALRAHVPVGTGRRGCQCSHFTKLIQHLLARFGGEGDSLLWGPATPPVGDTHGVPTELGNVSGRELLLSPPAPGSWGRGVQPAGAAGAGPARSKLRPVTRLPARPLISGWGRAGCSFAQGAELRLQTNTNSHTDGFLQPNGVTFAS